MAVERCGDACRAFARLIQVLQGRGRPMAQTAENIHEQYPLDGAALRLATDGTPTLIGLECADCGTRAFPPAPVCQCCRRTPLCFPIADLYTRSVVHVAPRVGTCRILRVTLICRKRCVFAHIVTSMRWIWKRHGGNADDDRCRRERWDGGKRIHPAKVVMRRFRIGVGMIPLLNIGKKRWLKSAAGVGHN